jgi:6-phosphogluconolactonase
MRFCRSLFCIALLGWIPSETRGETLVYFGTYTGAKSKGIYVSRLNTESRQLSEPVLAAEAVNPSFLAVHPSGKFLYAVNEVDQMQGEAAGEASAFAIDRATGRLKLLNRSSSKGPGPCYLSLDRSGRNLLLANYGGGSVAVLPVGEDGALGTATSFIRHQGPAEPHAHSIDVDAANRFALAADLGLDRIYVYRFDAAKGLLSAGDPPFATVDTKSGPRHLALHPGGKFVYVLNELSLTLTAMRYDAERGTLEAIQTISSLPEGVEVAPEFSGAEVVVHPRGRFLYASNRGHDTIAIFAIDEEAGKLHLLEHVSTEGKTPRGFGIDPTGSYLLAANQDSDTVVVFWIEPGGGRLSPPMQTVMVGSPVAVAFVTY